MTIIDEDTGATVKLPTCWAICGCCNGEGKSSLYLGAITGSDREPGGMWDDPDAFEDYINGGYDRTCDECRGTGKVRVVDHSKLTRKQRRQLREEIIAEREYQATVEAERRFGC